MAADGNQAMTNADRHGVSPQQSGLSGGLSTPQGFPSASLGQAMVERPVAMVGGRMVQVRPRALSLWYPCRRHCHASLWFSRLWSRTPTAPQSASEFDVKLV